MGKISLFLASFGNTEDIALLAEWSHMLPLSHQCQPTHSYYLLSPHRHLRLNLDLKADHAQT